MTSVSSNTNTVAASSKFTRTVSSPGEEYFQSFLTRYETFEQAGETGRTDRAALDNVLGKAHTSDMDLEDATVGAKSVAEYADILARAYRGNGIHDPIAFLKSLSERELEVIQHTKRMGHPINVEALSQEGAYNLLLTNDHSVDFNNDGFSEVGTSLASFYPPVNAPDSVKQVWHEMTKDMDDFERSRIAGILSFAMHDITDKGPKPRLDPSRHHSYVEKVDDQLDMLLKFRSMLAPGQFEGFFPFLMEYRELLLKQA